MPSLDKMFPSKFLKASDIDQDYEVTIRQVATDLVGQGAEQEEKFIVHFDEFDKGLVLNKTNGNLIAAQHGTETDDWIGKKVVLTVEDVAYQGKITPAIRVKRPARAVAPPRRPMSAPAPQGAKPRPTSQAQAAEQAADDNPFP